MASCRRLKIGLSGETCLAKGRFTIGGRLPTCPTIHLQSIMTGAQSKTAHSRELYIDGKWQPQSGNGSIDVLSASTEEVIGSVPEGTAADVDRAARAARAAFDNWSQTTVQERAAWLLK